MDVRRDAVAQGVDARAGTAGDTQMMGSGEVLSTAELVEIATRTEARACPTQRHTEARIKLGHLEPLEEGIAHHCVVGVASVGPVKGDGELKIGRASCRERVCQYV